MRAQTTMILMIMTLIGLYPHASLAADVDTIQIVDFGIYQTAFEGWETAPATSKGKIEIVSDRTLVALTDTIPSTPGTEIGVRYVVNGKHTGKPVDVLVKVIHSEGDSPTSDQWLRTRPVGSASFEGWKLDATSPKNITIQFYHDGRKMAEKSFTLQAPQQAKNRVAALGYTG